MITSLKKTTEIGQLFSISDAAAQHRVGQKFEDSDGTIYQYMKNTTGSACVAGDGYYIGFGNAAQSDANNPQVIAVTPATAQIGKIALAQAAIPDDYFGWFLTEGATTNSVGKLYFGNLVNHTQTRTTTVGEPLKLHDGIWADDTTWALGGTDALRTWPMVALEAVTAATSCHVYLTGEFFISTT